MNTFIIYYKYFGKKFKTEILAKDENQAKEIFLTSKICIDAVKNKEVEPIDKDVEYLKNIFGMK